MKKIVLALMLATTANMAYGEEFKYDFQGMLDFIHERSPMRLQDGDYVPAYTAEIPKPIVELMTQEELEALWPGAGVVAMYDSLEYTMYLNQDMDPNSVEGYSVILHELVHHVQNMNGMSKTNCPLNLENDAYRIQLDYLKINADQADPEFVKMIGLGQLLGTGGICYEDKRF